MNNISMLDKYLVYQPKVNLKTREIIGLEYLVIFVKLGSLQRIDTEKMIDSIESIEEMLELSNDVISKVISDMTKLDKMKCKINIYINMSSLELSNLNLYSWIDKNFNNYKNYIERLEIEITEKYEIKNKKIMQKKFSKIKELGFTITIDDLEYGFNQSNIINYYNIDWGKVDKILVRNFNNKKEELNYIINICNEKNIKLLVEGIETEEDFKRFLNLGFEFGQGYFFINQ